MNKEFLHLNDVYKSYDKKVILDNIDLTIEKGTFCTIIGPSGCGKSTLLKLILGQEEATSGTLELKGEPIGITEKSRGIVYQKYSLFPHLTVIENILFGFRLQYGLVRFLKEKKVLTKEALRYMEKVRLTDHKDKYPHQLSGGQQQRVAIVQALILKPEILLMDEPFGALDPTTREDVQLFLLELWEETKMTVFFVTHDISEAVFLGSRIVVLSQYYTDDRGEVCVSRGAKIVTDVALPKRAMSTNVKSTPEFQQLVTSLSENGFKPEHKKHVRDFNLTHPKSWNTLTRDELKDTVVENYLDSVTG